MKYKVLESKATPNGRMFCELVSFNNCGSIVYQTHVYETIDGNNYKELYRSYPIGKKVTALVTFKKYCNTYLRQKHKY